ncbi:MAG: PA2778 family cysteine peptidase [Pseudomonadota bacterium]
MPAGHGVELTEVPFFPQARYQCGPAALATALGSSGVAVAPEDLIDDVYVPGRRGSFQFEMIAAARRHGRIPVVLDTAAADRAGRLAALEAELLAGRPLLVLQDYHLLWTPRWHYAVVVGFDQDREQVILRSGREQRRLESFDAFLRRWARSDAWAVVLLKPGELPAQASADGYLRALIDASGRLAAADFERSLAVALRRWPRSADLNFAAANAARSSGDFDAARERFQKTLQLQPEHLGALNNYADLLLALGCVSEAQKNIDTAINLAESASPLMAVLQATEREVAAAAETLEPARCAAIGR